MPIEEEEALKIYLEQIAKGADAHLAQGIAGTDGQFEVSDGGVEQGQMLFVSLLLYVVDHHCLGSEDIFEVHSRSRVIRICGQHLAEAAFSLGKLSAILIEHC